MVTHTLTQELRAELVRCAKALKEYERTYAELEGKEYIAANPKHATAERSTLDLTKLLAKWRQMPVLWNKPK